MTAPHPILQDMLTSGAQPHEMASNQVAQLRSYYASDLFAFAWTFMGFRDLKPDPHGEICTLLRQWADRELDTLRLMIQVPRGSYKTSLCTIALSMWLVCRNPDSTILICNERVDNAKKWLRAIREVVSSNRTFQAIYQDLLPPGVHHSDRRSRPRDWKWSDEELLFNRRYGIAEASLTAVGVGTATTGGHWDYIIKDDLVSEDAKLSESVMARAKSWLDSSMPLQKPPYKGHDLVVCTPWTYNDVYRYALEQYGYKLYRRSALEVDSQGEMHSLLPHQWSVEELLEEQGRRPVYFSAQMMCRPRAGDSQSFDPAWIRRFGVRTDPHGERLLTIHQAHYDPKITELRRSDEVPPPEVPLWWCTRAILVDPAAAEATSTLKAHARTAIVAVAMDPWGRRYVLDCWAAKADPLTVIKRIIRMARDWQAVRVGIEEVTFSLLYRHWLTKEARETGTTITIYPLKPGGRHKDDRIENKIPGFRQGLYYLNDTTNMRLLEQEYLEYPHGQYRDILDALGYDMDLLRRPQSPGEHAEQQLHDELEDPTSTRCHVTGY